MRDLACSFALLLAISCSGGQSSRVTEPDPGGEPDCWDEQPCTGAGDVECRPPGSPRPSGKTPEHVDVGKMPTPCETDGDCEPRNEVCKDGACTPAPCSSSNECDGYCIGGTCWSEPGFCESYLKP
jgi:hypothetical protein